MSSTPLLKQGTPRTKTKNNTIYTLNRSNKQPPHTLHYVKSGINFCFVTIYTFVSNAFTKVIILVRCNLFTGKGKHQWK